MLRGESCGNFFGAESGLAIVLFALLFIISCNVVMSIGHRYQSKHYMPVLQKLMGTRLSKLYDIMIFVYLFSTTVIMLAGGGATLQVFELPYWVGTIILGIMVVVLFVWDTKGITSANSIVTPILIVCLIGLLFAFQTLKGFPFQVDFAAQQNWPSGITFTALNILPIVAVLSAFGKEIKTKGEIWIASIGSGLILGAISFFIQRGLTCRSRRNYAV